MKRARLPAAIILVALLAVAGYRLWRINSLVVDIASESRALGDYGESMENMLSPDNLARLEARLAVLSADLASLRAEAGPFLPVARLFEWLPGGGPDIAQSPALLDLGQNLLGGFQAAVPLLSSVSAELDSAQAAGRPLGPALVSALSLHADQVQQARQGLEQAQRARSTIDPSALSPGTRAYVDRLDPLLAQALGSVVGLDLLPTLLGVDRPREYLVLVQNSDELRPSGGFISSVARIRVANGDFELVESGDSYAIDNLQSPHPDPPAALKRYMQTNLWLVRDSNWSPDFPTSARDAARLYALDRHIDVDGVIAVNLLLVPRLLTATGEVQVTGYDETVDADNVLAKLQAYWASPQGQGQTGDWWEHRKDFAGALLLTLLQRIREGNVDRAPLLAALSNALASRELLLYLSDADAQAQVEAAGWSGSVSGGAGDALMVVDSNLGYNKVDPNISRSGELQVKLEPGGSGESTVKLAYRNLSPDTGELCQLQSVYLASYAAMQQGCYWDYVRVVAAPGARQISSSVGDEQVTEDPIGVRPVLSGYFVVPRGQARQVEFVYESPRSISRGSIYTLRIEKQPGTGPVPWHVKIALPAGWTDYRADPLPERAAGNVLEYDTTVDRDWQVTVRRDDYSGNRAAGLALAGVALLSGGWWWLRSRSRTVRRGAE